MNVMRANDLNLDNVDSINEFYTLLEENALFLEKSHDITEVLLKYKNRTSSDEEKQKLHWEVEVFIFSFHGKRIFSFSTSNGKEVGEVAEYPELNSYQQEAFDYLKQRAELSASALLRARYNHLLWNSIITKNTTFALRAAENYVEAIRQCQQVEDDEDMEYSHLIGRLFENLVGVVSEGKQCIQETKETAFRLLHDSPKFSFWAKHGIIDDMLKYPKIFKSTDFNNTLGLFELHLQNVNSIGEDFQLVNYYLPTAIKVAQKQKSGVKKWYEEIGKAYIRMAEEENEDERSWIKLEEYRQAIDAFRLSGNQKRKQEIEQLYFELKPKVKLEEFSIELDEETRKKLEQLNSELKRQALSLLKQPPEFIYAHIAKGSFFPKHEDVLIAAKDKKNHFLDFVTTIYFDNNKNSSKKSSETDEKQEVLETYGLRLKETLLPFLHYLIILGIKSGHLTCRNFLAFLIQRSWIGKPFIKIDLGGNNEVTNWINQIAPSISEFFSQVLAWGESKYYTPNFILCTDSLTLKIEGLFRNFSERLNVSTSVGKRKGVQEALAHDILNNETIKQYFDEDDRLLFDYLFSSEGGLNLRNNIAHCFYSENEYHPDKMLLLIAVLLRLGKYNIEKRD
jgi:hypothetical protein